MTTKIVLDDLFYSDVAHLSEILKVYTSCGKVYVGSKINRDGRLALMVGNQIKLINERVVAIEEVNPDFLLSKFEPDWSQCPSGYCAWQRTQYGAYWYGFNEYGKYHLEAPTFGMNSPTKEYYRPSGK